jgi:hypothetical protein
MPDSLGSDCFPAWLQKRNNRFEIVNADDKMNKNADEKMYKCAGSRI